MPGGYAWWYIDAVSDDRRHGLTIIAFVGSVFSPYYAYRRRGTSPDPENHVAVNVAIYGDAGYRWTMTERNRAALNRDAQRLEIGPSRMTVGRNGTLTVDLDEVAVPIPRRVRGRVVIEPAAFGTESFQLDAAGRHVWQPIAPSAPVKVALEGPGVTWEGTAYVDRNWGSEPLAEAFRVWTWSRTIEVGGTRIFYDLVDRDGHTRHLHLEYPAANGTPRGIVAPPPALLPKTRWRLERTTRSDAGAAPKLLETWEDGPFYARALIEQRLDGRAVQAVHETVSLDRFDRPIVQAMLPFRMPRTRWRRST